jgi:hypothetical protein
MKNWSRDHLNFQSKTSNNQSSYGNFPNRGLTIVGSLSLAKAPIWPTNESAPFRQQPSRCIAVGVRFGSIASPCGSWSSSWMRAGTNLRFVPALIRWSVHLAPRRMLPRTVDDRGRCFLGPIHTQHDIRNMGMNSPFGAAYAFQDA